MSTVHDAVEKAKTKCLDEGTISLGWGDVKWYIPAGAPTEHKGQKSTPDHPYSVPVDATSKVDGTPIIHAWKKEYKKENQKNNRIRRQMEGMKKPTIRISKDERYYQAGATVQQDYEQQKEMADAGKTIGKPFGAERITGGAGVQGKYAEDYPGLFTGNPLRRALDALGISKGTDPHTAARRVGLLNKTEYRYKYYTTQMERAMQKADQYGHLARQTPIWRYGERRQHLQMRTAWNRVAREWLKRRRRIKVRISEAQGGKALADGNPGDLMDSTHNDALARAEEGIEDLGPETSQADAVQFLLDNGFFDEVLEAENQKVFDLVADTPEEEQDFEEEEMEAELGEDVLPEDEMELELNDPTHAPLTLYDTPPTPTPADKNDSTTHRQENGTPIISQTHDDGTPIKLAQAAGGGGQAGQVGYPAKYAQYRQGGRFGDVPGVGGAGTQGPAGGSPGTGGAPKGQVGQQGPIMGEQMMPPTHEEIVMHKWDLQHEERMALIQAGINPDTGQPFEEEREARQMLMNLENDEDIAEDYEEEEEEPEFLSREEMLSKSGNPKERFGTRKPITFTEGEEEDFSEMEMDLIEGD
jgi:hypothetical protein